MNNTILKWHARDQAARGAATVLKVPAVPRDGGYSALARDLCLQETGSIETTRQLFTRNHIGIKDTTRLLTHAVSARMEAWLDDVVADQPLNEFLYFDATNTVDGEGLQSLSFFSGATLAPEKLVVASAVFCLPNGEFLYDREAIQAFLYHDPKGVFYWGPEVKSLPQAASLNDLFLSLPSYTSTEGGQENCFSFEYEIEDSSQAVIEVQDDYCCDNEDEGEDKDDQTESEASFGCVTAAVHDKALVEETPNYVNKKKGPPPAIWIPNSLQHALPIRIVRPLKSFQRPVPRKDNATGLHAMRANMRDAQIIWPTYPKNFGDIQHLLAPRMLARPPRPGPGMLQAVHPEVKAQWETSKPLYLACISKCPDPQPAMHFPFERSPDYLHSFDLLRLPSTTASPSIHSFVLELVPAPLRIDSKGVWPRPGSHTIRSVDPNIRAQWRAVLPKLKNAGELEERKARTSLVLKPLRLLRKMLQAATRKSGWVF
ncbi:hypothetical protein PMIN04_002085 [Paraphaeosphaeria minitans]